MCKLSIVVPIYNKKQYLSNSIGTILKCRSDDIEVVLVNDGSTDGSLEILQKFAEEDNRIRLITIPNTGVSNARNVGIKEARGNWIWFIDADDIPEMKFAIDFLKNESTAQYDIYMGDFKKIEGDQSILVHNPDQGILNQTELAVSFAALQFHNGYYGYLWNKIIRLALVKENMIHFKNGLTLAEDLDFMVQIYKCCQAVFTTDTVALNYRVDTYNSSSEKKIDYTEQLMIQIGIKDWFCSIKKYSEYADLLDTNITKYAAFVLFYAAEDGQNVQKIADKLLASSKVKEALVLWNDPSIMGKIARYLYQGQTKKIQYYLAVRNFVRKIYRLGRK